VGDAEGGEFVAAVRVAEDLGGGVGHGGHGVVRVHAVVVEEFERARVLFEVLVLIAVKIEDGADVFEGAFGAHVGFEEGDVGEVEKVGMGGGVQEAGDTRDAVGEEVEVVGEVHPDQSVGAGEGGTDERDGRGDWGAEGFEEGGPRVGEAGGSLAGDGTLETGGERNDEGEGGAERGDERAVPGVGRGGAGVDAEGEGAGEDLVGWGDAGQVTGALGCEVLLLGVVLPLPVRLNVKRCDVVHRKFRGSRVTSRVLW
jgi:hypothetical protein